MTAAKLSHPDELPARTRRLVELVVAGHSYPEVAAALGLKRQTVAERVHELGKRLEGRGPPRLRLVRWWTRAIG